MKKLLTNLSPKILFLVLLMSLSFTTAHGQIWNNIGSKVNDKLKKKADQKIEQKIDETIDKSFDKTEKKIEESFQDEDNSSENQENPPSFDMASMFGGKADIRDQYKFDFGITYKTSSTNSNGKVQEVPEITMWMGESGITAINVVEQNNTIILDSEKQTMVMIQENEKTYMAMQSKINEVAEKIAEQSTQEANIPENVKIEKIGSENLLGYKCDIYKITSDGKESKVWLTQDIQFNYSKMAGGFNNTFGQKQKSNLPDLSDIPQGMMLKVISSDPQTKESMVMEATKVFKDGTTIHMSSYKKMGM